jgi:hypothetical protein
VLQRQDGLEKVFAASFYIAIPAGKSNFRNVIGNGNVISEWENHGVGKTYDKKYLNESKKQVPERWMW